MTIMEIASLNYPKLVKSALQVVSDKNLAKEAVHEAIIKCHTKELKGEISDTYKLTYLHHACKNMAIDMFCRKRKKVVDVVYTENEIDVLDHPEYSETPDKYFKLCILHLENNREPIHVAIFKYRFLSKLTIVEMSKMSGFSNNIISKSLKESIEMIKLNLNYNFYVNIENE